MPVFEAPKNGRVTLKFNCFNIHTYDNACRYINYDDMMLLTSRLNNFVDKQQHY